MTEAMIALAARLALRALAEYPELFRDVDDIIAEFKGSDTLQTKISTILSNIGTLAGHLSGLAAVQPPAQPAAPAPAPTPTITVNAPKNAGPLDGVLM